MEAGDTKVTRKRRTTHTPSFDGLWPASEASSRAKRANRSEDMKHEVLLRSTLHKMGLRYRKTAKDLSGNPDIVFRSARVAVFCDGDFWHGRNWRRLHQKLAAGSNGDYWIEKIRVNKERDRRNTRRLESLGWHVVRVWESDVLSNPLGVAQQIARLVRSQSADRNTASSSRRSAEK